MSRKIYSFNNAYVIGKDTPNKLKLFQCFGGELKEDGSREVVDNITQYTIRNVPDGKEDEITQNKEVLGTSTIYYRTNTTNNSIYYSVCDWSIFCYDFTFICY